MSWFTELRRLIGRAADRGDRVTHIFLGSAVSRATAGDNLFGDGEVLIEAFGIPVTENPNAPEFSIALRVEPRVYKNNKLFLDGQQV